MTIAQLKQDLAKAGTWLRTLTAVAAGGAVNAGVTAYTTGTQDLPALKRAFVHGALTALAFYWLHSPLGKKVTADNTPSA